MARRIVIVGGGIVGSALAERLAGDNDVTVLDAGPAAELRGSTGHAPGYVGCLGESPVLTELATASASAYDALDRGFDRVGGLEVAYTPTGAAELERRAKLAEDAGLPHRMLAPEDAVALMPALIDPRRCLGGLHFPADGTASAGVLTMSLRERAALNGARFRTGRRITGIDVHGERVRSVRTADETFPADDVVVASGFWSREVAELAGAVLPLTPVAHPYVYGPPGPSNEGTPFVRWPESHVYARGHGHRLGLGSYDHIPMPVPGTHAELPWPGEPFDGAIRRGIDLLPTPFEVTERLNGVFSMTADNLPLLGRISTVDGLWAASAIWVTHAAGAAANLAELMADREPTVGHLDALDPNRFADADPDTLTTRALRLYRDIYATG